MMIPTHPDPDDDPVTRTEATPARGLVEGEGAAAARSLRVMQRRLYDLGGRSRNLTLLRTARHHSLDLTSLPEGGGPHPDALLETLFSPGTRKPVELARIGDPYLDGSDLSRRLQLIERERRALEQETGANDLYLAWPMVVGQFPDGQLVRAPLVLLPVRLTQMQGKWVIDRPPGTAPRLNLTLLLAYGHYLKQPLAEGLLSQDLDEGAGAAGGWLALKTHLYTLLKEHLPLIDYDQSVYREPLAPLEPLTRLELEKQTRPGLLKVTHQGVIGLFALADPYLSDDFDRMIVAGVRSAGELLPDTAAEPPPGGILPAYPLPSDPSQERALGAVAQGQSVLVHGPPGTGKSQLITNLIAGHIAAGQRVMLVCQKRAALDVVAERLDGLGLSPSVARVHDTIKDRGALFAQLAERLEARPTLADELAGTDLQGLIGQVRIAGSKRAGYIEQLDQVLEALHKPRPDVGRTAHELYLRAARRGPFIDLPPSTAIAWPGATQTIEEVVGLMRTGRRLKGCPRLWRLSKGWGSLSQAAVHSRAEQIAGPLAVLGQKLALLPLARPLSPAAWQKLSTGPMDALSQALEGGKGGASPAWSALAPALLGMSRPARREALERAAALRRYLTTPPTLAWDHIEVAMRLVAPAGGPVSRPLSLSDPLSVRQSLMAVRSMFAEGVEGRRRGWVSWALWYLPNPTRRALVQHLTGKGLEATLITLTVLLDQIDRWVLIIEATHTLGERLSLGSRGRPSLPAPNDLAAWHQIAEALPRVMVMAKALSPALPKGTLPRWKATDWTQAAEQLPALYQALRLVQQGTGLGWVSKKQWNLLAEQLAIPDNYTTWATEIERDLSRYLDILARRDTQREALSTDARRLLAAARSWRRAHPGTPARLARLLDTSLSLAALVALERQEPVLTRAMPELLDDLGRDLDTAERARLQAATRWLPARLTELLLERVPPTLGGGHTALLHQLKKKRQLWSLRRILAEHTNTILGLVPCWLVSPETASAIMPLERGLFDLVIFDEGSQCFAERAIPALYRARQVVIAGDAQQLQPSALYQVRWQQDEETDEPIEETDSAHLAYSLLDLARGRLHETMLTEHYRSQHPGLIAFSSRHFYQGRLGSLPDYEYWRAPSRPAIRWHTVPGQWQGQTNRPEAEAVVTRLLELGRQEGPDRGLSVGVVTFNALQQGLITDLLEARCAQIQTEQGATPPLPPGLFIKNIENVQGDERDLILFSVGYARDNRGRLAMQFGSLGQAGGANRLNVALTRSRWGMEVFTDLSERDFRLTERSPEGVRLLAAFIAYARAGEAEGRIQTYPPSSNDAPSAGKAGATKEGLSLASVLRRRDASWQPCLSYAPLTYQPAGQSAQGLLFTDDRSGRYRDSALERWGWRPAYARRQRHWPVTLYTARALWLSQPPTLKSPKPH